MATLNTAVLPITDKQYACSQWNTFLLSVGKSKRMQCFLQIPIYTFHKTLIPCSPVHESTPNSFLLVSQLAVIDGRLQSLQNWEYCRVFLLQTKEISSIKISWMAIPIVTQKQLIHGKEKKKKSAANQQEMCKTETRNYNLASFRKIINGNHCFKLASFGVSEYLHTFQHGCSDTSYLFC